MIEVGAVPVRSIASTTDHEEASSVIQVAESINSSQVDSSNIQLISSVDHVVSIRVPDAVESVPVSVKLVPMVRFENDLRSSKRSFAEDGLIRR